MQRAIFFPELTNHKGSLTQTEMTLLGSFLVLTEARTILELGVFKGDTTKFICNFIVENNLTSKVYGFDVPKVVEELKKDPELLNYINLGLLEFVPGFLPLSMKEWLKKNSQPIDFVLDDALHDYSSVYGELKLIWPKLANNGYILCHDYTHKYFGVRHAVNKFAKKQNANILPFSSSILRSETFGSVLIGLSKKKPEHILSMTEKVKQEFYPFKVLFARSKLWKIIKRYSRKR